MSNSSSQKQWSSGVIALGIAGVVVLAMSRHGDVHRDVYPTRADCQRDWPQHHSECEPRGSGTAYFGPRYEAGYRPPTPHAELRLGNERVSRAGFGRSGARFGGGS